MDPAKFPANYQYQSDFARRYVAQGRAEMIVRLLSLRFGPLGGEALARISKASLDELDKIGERVLTAQSVEEAIGPS